MPILLEDLKLPSLDRVEIQPGVILIGEPTPVPGTNLLRGLAQVGRALCLVELKVTLTGKEKNFARKGEGA